MAERLQTYSEKITAPDGTVYLAHAAGERDPAGTWTAWLVFEPVGGSGSLRTQRETTQPEREDLVYWATGLEPVYLEGALSRAQ